jgi:hypothetical protein
VTKELSKLDDTPHVAAGRLFKFMCRYVDNLKIVINHFLF